MEKNLISIVIPAYNIEKYIGRCLDSVLRQTYTNLEIIVINDGSKDNTGNIIDEYAKKDSRIIIIHKENGGVSSARLAGVNRATGDFIGFVDGDDVIDSDMYEFLLNNLLENDADISHCGYVMDFPDGHSDYYYNTGKKVIQDHIQGWYDVYSGEFVEPGLVIKLYKKEIVKDFDKDENWMGDIKINEDVLMNYILFSRANKSIYEDKCPYHYTLRKGSAATSKASRNKYLDPLRVADELSNANNLPGELLNLAYLKYIRCLINCSAQNDYKDIKKYAKNKLKVELKEYTQMFELPRKETLMSIGVVYFEPLYFVVRKVYDYFTGNYKKYRV